MMKKDQINKLFKNFKKKYKDKYEDEELWYYIEENFWNFIDKNSAPDVLMQIYTELGIESPDGNFYKEHLKRLKERFDIRGNVLDVASGSIPAFANLLAHEQLKIGSGTVTLYEPLLIVDKPKYPNMTMYRQNFTEYTYIKNFDLITGIMPCGVTETLIEQACRNQKDFYVAMCGCTHFEYVPYDFLITPESYQYYIIEKTEQLLQRYDNGTLEVEHLDNYEINYPILYNKKK